MESSVSVASSSGGLDITLPAVSFTTITAPVAAAEEGEEEK